MRWFLAAIVAAVAGLAAAQESYPSRPIKFILPFPPGGGTDILGRQIAEKLGERLGQPVVTDRPSLAISPPRRAPCNSGTEPELRDG